jgi:AraC-like DNA-binding protein
MLAVKWLAGGASIQQVAAELGYESMPGFVTMFRKALGTSPDRYMAERHAGRLWDSDVGAPTAVPSDASLLGLRCLEPFRLFDSSK